MVTVIISYFMHLYYFISLFSVSSLMMALNDLTDPSAGPLARNPTFHAIPFRGGSPTCHVELGT